MIIPQSAYSNLTEVNQLGKVNLKNKKLTFNNAVVNRTTVLKDFTYSQIGLRWCKDFVLKHI